MLNNHFRTSTWVNLVTPVYSYGSSAKLDSLEIVSGAAFRIIGLTKIPKIEFLPLDWIYRSIRINTVVIRPAFQPFNLGMSVYSDFKCCIVSKSVLQTVLSPFLYHLSSILLCQNTVRVTELRSYHKNTVHLGYQGFHTCTIGLIQHP